MYVGRNGELMCQTSELTTCNRIKQSKMASVSSYVELELEKLSYKLTTIDEGFFEKLSGSGASTNPSSPESITTSCTDDL